MRELVCTGDETFLITQGRSCNLATDVKRHCPAHAASCRLRTVKVVALGGGTGLPVVLRSLKPRLFADSDRDFTDEDRSRLTAIVTVTDDGGSSGRIRNDFNILPPGDIRNCLAALSHDSVLSSQLFQYRFPKGDGLAGHSLGNLILAALADLRSDFVEAVRCCGEMLNIHGRILPSTSGDVRLAALCNDGTIVHGETAIDGNGKRIRRIFLNPKTVEALPSAIEALEQADLIIVGPGSLYTSVIPNLLVNGIADATRSSKAKKVYVCNLMAEAKATIGYTAADHVQAITDHCGSGIFDYVVLNVERVPAHIRQRYAKEGSHPVRVGTDELRRHGTVPILADLACLSEGTVRHDEDKLGRLLIKLV